MDGGLQEEAITSETREGLESEGGGGRSDAEDSGRGVRAETGTGCGGLLRMKSICCRKNYALNNRFLWYRVSVCVRVQLAK